MHVHVHTCMCVRTPKQAACTEVRFVFNMYQKIHPEVCIVGLGDGRLIRRCHHSSSVTALVWVSPRETSLHRFRLSPWKLSAKSERGKDTTEQRRAPVMTRTLARGWGGTVTSPARPALSTLRCSRFPVGYSAGPHSRLAGRRAPKLGDRRRHCLTALSGGGSAG